MVVPTSWISIPSHTQDRQTPGACFFLAQLNAIEDALQVIRQRIAHCAPDAAAASPWLGQSVEEQEGYGITAAVHSNKNTKRQATQSQLVMSFLWKSSETCLVRTLLVHSVVVMKAVIASLSSIA
jgi:hypothetical protein